MVTEQERKLVADRLRQWIDELPIVQRRRAFFHALGISLTPEQMLTEVEGASQIGDIIVKQELRAIKYYQP